MPISQESWDRCIDYMDDNDLSPGDPLADSEVDDFVEWHRDGHIREDKIRQMLADLRLVMALDPGLTDEQLRFLRIWRVADQCSAQNWGREDGRFIICDDIGDPLLAKDWAGLREVLLVIAGECCYDGADYEVSLYDLEAPNWREPFAKVALRMVTQVSVSLVGDGFLDDGDRLADDDVRMQLSEPDIMWPLRGDE